MYKNKHGLLVGLGLQGGGVATARWLVKQGVKLTITDLKNTGQLKSSLKSLKGLRIKYILGKHPRDLSGFDFIIQNPAVSNDSLVIKEALRRKLPIENEASLFFKYCPSLIIVAVTGSKGKSTTTALLGHIFRQYKKQTIVAGNIRDKVMLDILPQVKPTTPVVLELSSWQLEGLARWHLSPHISVITNVLPDHLDRYSSFGQYTQAKFNIFKWQSSRDWAIVNFDNNLTKNFGHKIKSQVYWFSSIKPVPRGCFIKDQWIYVRDQRDYRLLPLGQIRLPGQHNIGNVLAAVTAALVAGIPVKYIKLGVGNFSGIHSRLQLVFKQQGVEYYNDTTATTPDATMAAINTFSGKSIILIAGGKDKNLDYHQLVKLIIKLVKYLILLPGSASTKIGSLLPKKYQVILADNMKVAVAKAKNLARPGDKVVLSPAAASFNLFINEWDRGSQFVRAVKSHK